MIFHTKVTNNSNNPSIIAIHYSLEGNKTKSQYLSSTAIYVVLSLVLILETELNSLRLHSNGLSWADDDDVMVAHPHSSPIISLINDLIMSSLISELLVSHEK